MRTRKITSKHIDPASEEAGDAVLAHIAAEGDPASADVELPATAARQAAEAARNGAVSRLVDAEAHQADLTRRLDGGDASVTADDTVRAASEIDRCQRLLSAAQRDLATAKAEEQVAVAEQTASELPHRLDGDSGRDIIERAAERIANELASLTARMSERGGRVAAVRETAEKAGLVNGQTDPFSPVMVETRHPAGGRPHKVLLVKGETYAEVGPQAATLRALRKALGSGSGLTVEVAQ